MSKHQGGDELGKSKIAHCDDGEVSLLSIVHVSYLRQAICANPVVYSTSYTARYEEHNTFKNCRFTVSLVHREDSFRVAPKCAKDQRRVNPLVDGEEGKHRMQLIFQTFSG